VVGQTVTHVPVRTIHNQSDYENYENPAYSPDGNFISNHFTDINSQGYIRFWNANSGKIVKTVEFGNRLGFTCFLASHSLFAAVSGNVLRVWNYQSQESGSSDDAGFQLKPFESIELQHDARWVTFHPFLKQIFWIEGERGKTQPKLHIFDLESGKRLPFSKNVTQPFDTVAVLPQGTKVALSAEVIIDGHRKVQIQIWDYITGQLLVENIESWELSSHSWGLTGLSVSPDGRFLTFATNQKQLKIFGLRQNQELASISLTEGESFWQSSWSPDGNHLATLGNSGQVNVWHIKEIRQRLAELRLDWED
jgi:WD40 repeat protein